ncbi:DUF1659 domain-containing protein (plasmid) [Haloimpatiens sp. FM7330]|uniref:DUF1659 domain-containing protein n=1 Tax=Haloimpatiens sp. FM7330 TaxID=3298610 RepID=UPI003642E1FE
MAVGATKVDTDLVIKVRTGTDAHGKETYKNKRFSKIKVTAEDAAIFEVAKAISEILIFDPVDVKRVDSNILMNE